MSSFSPKSWHFYRSRRKAIRSHSWTYTNYNALSKYIANELRIGADERKNTLLPCGYTLAESWAALRKCWLAFHISRSNNNTPLMAQYSLRINKLQRQMGIQVTTFDDHIVRERQTEEDDEEEEHEEEKEKDEEVESELSMEYEGLMENARKGLKLDPESNQQPREEIFAKAVHKKEGSDHLRRGGETYIRRRPVTVTTKKRACVRYRRSRDQKDISYGLPPSTSRSCYYRRRGSEWQDEESLEEEEGTSKSSYYQRQLPKARQEDESLEEEEQEEDSEVSQEKRRKSCSYERK